MKKQLILAGLLVVGFASAQEGNVGINTSTPQATMDITANTADGDKVEGLMIPRITYAKMQAMKANLTEKHDGLMVYVTDLTDYNTGRASKNTIYDFKEASSYFVYNAFIQEFVPFTPSGLTAIRSPKDTEGVTSYELALSAVDRMARGGNIENVGVGSINLSHPYLVVRSEATAKGVNSISLNGKSEGDYSFAAQGGTAQGEYAIALGQGAQAQGDYSFATQFGLAEQMLSVAIGYGAKAQGGGATAVGYGATAVGDNSFATTNSTASGAYAVATGGGIAEGFTSFAFGGTARGSRSTSLSGSAIADGSVAIYGNAGGPDSFAAMDGATNNVLEVAFGKNFQTDTDMEANYTGSNYVELSPTRQIFSVGGIQTIPNNNKVTVNNNALIILRNAHTGIGILSDWQNPANSKPTEMLDVNGNIRVRGTVGADIITAGGACTNLGTITFSGDNFYGCKSTGWVRLNN